MTGDDHELRQRHGASTSTPSATLSAPAARSPIGSASARRPTCTTAADVRHEQGGLRDARASSSRFTSTRVARTSPPSRSHATGPSQLAVFNAQYPASVPARTNRTHCIAWSDWDSEATAARDGVRFDTNYYYWPATGSRTVRHVHRLGDAAALRRDGGALIDVYQATTQLTDESEIDYGTAHQHAARQRAGPAGLLRCLHRQHPHGPVRCSAAEIIDAAQGQRRAGGLLRADARLGRRAQQPSFGGLASKATG